MSDKIYIWEAGNGNVGHGSMTLHDGTHISWWPKDDKSKSSAKSHMVGFILSIAYFLFGKLSTKYKMFPH
jgi:heme/copper-type cytochrome/quinol oxidase subunit 4